MELTVITPPLPGHSTYFNLCTCVFTYAKELHQRCHLNLKCRHNSISRYHANAKAASLIFLDLQEKFTDMLVKFFQDFFKKWAEPKKAVKNDACKLLCKYLLKQSKILHIHDKETF